MTMLDGMFEMREREIMARVADSLQQLIADQSAEGGGNRWKEGRRGGDGVMGMGWIHEKCNEECVRT